jgi:GAF domain/7TM diverse intracellular signalling
MMLGLIFAIALSAPQSAIKLGGASHIDPQAVTDLSGLWLFYKGDSLAFARPSLDEGKWEQRKVPMLDAPSSYRWAGKGWYRLHIYLGDEVAGSDQMISFAMVREAAEIYVNGALVAERGRMGSRPQGGARLLPLTAIIPGHLLVPGNNVIAARILDPTYNGGIVGGPLLIGAPALVRAQTDPRAAVSFATALGFAIVSLCIGLGTLLARGRTATRESAWLVVSAFSLSLYHLGGTGFLEFTVPNIELSTRLPVVGAVVSALALAQYFAKRYDSALQAQWPILPAALVFSVLVLLFIPASWYFEVSRPFALTAVIVCSLYAAHVSGQALRRDEEGGRVVFSVAVLLVVMAVIDGVSATRADVLPPLASGFGVLGLITLTFVNVRQASAELSNVIARMQKLEKRLEERSQIGLLDAAALSIKNAMAFLDVAIREAAIVMSVRRCSLVLEGPDRELRVMASVGLPKHATQNALPREGSIVGYVFSHGEAVSNGHLPLELENAPRAGNYVTSAFMSNPIKVGARTVGVINVSDKNDGRPFTSEDEQMMVEVCAKLALVLARTGPA